MRSTRVLSRCGLTGRLDAVESEGFDRSDLNLPGHQDDLVRAVIAANPHTVVVVNSGAPVPWREDAAAILLTVDLGDSAVIMTRPERFPRFTEAVLAR